MLEDLGRGKFNILFYSITKQIKTFLQWLIKKKKENEKS